MPNEQEVASASRALAAGLALIASFLGLRQWYERRARSAALSPPDHDHFARQDRRRWAGVAALAAIALLALAASRTPVRDQGRGNVLFVVVWVVVMGLLVVLLILAMTDWMATRRYARRQRKQLFRDSIEQVRRERQRIDRAPPELGEGSNGDPTSRPDGGH
jgi:hypothetical protein